MSQSRKAPPSRMRATGRRANTASSENVGPASTADIDPSHLAQRVHRWLHDELGYRPTADLLSSKPGAEPATRQDIQTLCRSQLMPAFQHLLQHVYARQHVAHVRHAIRTAQEKHMLAEGQVAECTQQASSLRAGRQEQQQLQERVDTYQARCRAALGEIEDKEREIERLEDRIRRAQHRVHLKRAFRNNANNHTKTIQDALERIEQTTSVLDTGNSMPSSDESIVRVQRRIAALCSRLAELTKQGLASGTPLQDDVQAAVVAEIMETLNSSDPAAVLKAVALSLKLHAKAAKEKTAAVDLAADAKLLEQHMQEQGHMSLLSTLQTCLNQHVQLFIDAEEAHNSCRTLEERVAQAELDVYRAATALASDEPLARLIGDAVASRATEQSAQKAVASLQARIKALEKQHCEQEQAALAARDLGLEQVRQAEEDLTARRQWILLLQRATAELRQRLVHSNAQATAFQKDHAIPLARQIDAVHSQLTSCVARENAAFNGIDLRRGEMLSAESDRGPASMVPAKSLSLRRLDDDPAVERLTKSLGNGHHSSSEALASFIGTLGVETVTRQMRLQEYQRNMKNAREQIDLQASRMHQIVSDHDNGHLLATSTAADASIASSHAADLLSRAVTQKTQQETKRAKEQLDAALQSAEQANQLCASVRDLYAERELFYSGKLGEDWLRIQGQRFNELIHEPALGTPRQMH
ncbi:hypothetical protein THASP1DRAFT_33031 [Thamnocephalis sphaerospora]|uniref:Uncharacterized protein n=1 Tax=Thamnocephalis sphaerospora TaxID=78915 RepID=A0A4V1IVT0_9FUNG|nr:hypothetical protein THASP1DRAFT_33031 [Thamnocephalis sphaerospora]|eukprot:RKP05129.1 hypothetical protein THASP1DRAFT_33031 [Thamnocephalis sphaerospora]